MTNEIPNFDGIKANIAGMNRFFESEGTKVDNKTFAAINSIFKECDVEDRDGNKKPDNELTGNERISFMEKIKNLVPEKIYERLAVFFAVIDATEMMDELKNSEN